MEDLEETRCETNLTRVRLIANRNDIQPLDVSVALV